MKSTDPFGRVSGTLQDLRRFNMTVCYVVHYTTDTLNVQIGH